MLEGLLDASDGCLRDLKTICSMAASGDCCRAIAIRSRTWIDSAMLITLLTA
jgi:hypothetical protein